MSVNIGAPISHEEIAQTYDAGMAMMKWLDWAMTVLGELNTGLLAIKSNLGVNLEEVRAALEDASKAASVATDMP